MSRIGAALHAIQTIRFLDPARDGDRFVGRPLGALLGELGAAKAARDLSDLILTDGTMVELVDGGSAFLVVRVQPRDETRSRVTVRTVDSGLLPDLLDERISQICEARGLSPREREVLRLMQRGHGVEHLAALLEITARTVKFHQGNILRKLGAESRLDLLRVLLP